MAKNRKNTEQTKPAVADTSSITDFLAGEIDGSSQGQEDDNRQSEKKFRQSNAERDSPVPKRKPRKIESKKETSADKKDNSSPKPAVEPEKKSYTLDEKEFLKEYLPEFNTEILDKQDEEFNQYQKMLYDYRNRQMDESFRKSKEMKEEEKKKEGGKTPPKKRRRRSWRLDAGSTAILAMCGMLCIFTVWYLLFWS